MKIFFNDTKLNKVLSTKKEGQSKGNLVVVSILVLMSFVSVGCSSTSTTTANTETKETNQDGQVAKERRAPAAVYRSRY